MGTLTQRRQRFLLVLAARIVPASAALDADARGALLQLIGETLAGRPAAMRLQVGAFLVLLRWTPVFRFGRPFDHLGPDAQDATLRWFQRCPLQRVRSGFWGVRTLVMLGFYGRPDVGPSIAYTPGTDGIRVLHARARR